MKGSCTLVASVVAASTVALSSSTPSFSSPVVEDSSRSSSMEKNSGSNQEKFAPRFDGLRDVKDSSRSSSMEKNSGSNQEKFAPRFDGLRFIETLEEAFFFSGMDLNVKKAKKTQMLKNEDR
ncbi:unnamed protein product [Dovyalis caffra]|uniref:Uncharacterized protein n=1 Tax=Dovyalis caffra TaxID=77055 RepID=A0AAV1S7F0_9ROSI|nr:unnamed protein product [Dovyalis caffra]